jgi:hypothetical protein
MHSTSLAFIVEPFSTPYALKAFLSFSSAPLVMISAIL